MQIGQVVRTIDNKEGTVRHITRFSVGSLQLEECCWVELPGAIEGCQHPRYLGSQLTPIEEPKKPKELPLCRIPDSPCDLRHKDGRQCKWKWCSERWHPSSYAERLQWAWAGVGFEYFELNLSKELDYLSTESPKCACKGNEYCEACLPEPQYICEKAEGCKLEGCIHHTPHTKEPIRRDCLTEPCCSSRSAKCIPVEDWFVMQHNDTINGPYWSLVGQSKRLTENEAKEMARQWGGRAFKWGIR
jgi:hypothetical protein